MPPSKPSRPARVLRPAGPPLGAVLGHGDLATSLLLVFPLLLVYEVGVLFAPIMNGVDFLSRNLFALVDYDRTTYFLVHLGLGLVYLGLLAWLRRRRAFHPRLFLPMVLESAIYALTLGSFIHFVMRSVLGIDPALALGAPALAAEPILAQQSALSRLVLSIGAGVHEELVFRLGLFAGGAALLRLIGVRHVLAVALALVISSVLFSAVHHVGPLGDPFTLDVFVYRLLAGVLFGALFYYRSLAHAVYTHALYDIYVLVIL